MSAPDFVAVGHVTLDRFGEVTRPGGAALYAAVTAHRLGLSAGILTSHDNDYPLELLPPRIEVVSRPAPATTVFEHDPGDGTRRLRVASRALPLGERDVPADWRDAGMVVLAPVIDEVDPALVHTFDEAAIGAAAQGWLRALDEGRVTSRVWSPPASLLGRLQMLVASVEDIRGQEAQAIQWLQRVPVGALTAGEVGAWLFVNGERYAVRPRPAREVDATGAGDVFAATFLIEYQRHGDAWEAAVAAACAASLSVEGEGWSAVPDRAALDAAVAAYRQQT